MYENCCIFIAIFLLIFLLFVFIFTNCVQKENFTAPGLTLTIPPSWFPQIAAKPYRMNDWKTHVYLDRYPFHKGMTVEESNALASTNRFWIQ